MNNNFSIFRFWQSFFFLPLICYFTFGFTSSKNDSSTGQAIIKKRGLVHSKIFWVSDMALPGETVMLIGDGLDKEDIQVKGVKLEDDGPGEPGNENEFQVDGQPLEILQRSRQSLKVALPEEWEEGTFAIWLASEDERSGTMYINHPAIWWLQGDLGLSASPGGMLYVLGKSFINPKLLSKESTPAIKVVLKGPGEVALQATPDDNYSVSVELPEDLPTGEYQVYVHNGSGGASGWSKPVSIFIQQPDKWPETVFNVRDFGAVGTGEQDDTGAIQAALNKAEENGGGVVYFPRGRYQVTEMLDIPRFTVLKGEKREWVNVFWPDMTADPEAKRTVKGCTRLEKDPPESMIRGANSFGLEDITFYCSNFQSFVVADTEGEDAGNVFLHRLRVRANQYYGHLAVEGKEDRESYIAEASNRFMAVQKGFGNIGLVILGGSNIEISDCDLYSSHRGVFLKQPRGARIERNVIYSGRYAGNGLIGGTKGKKAKGVIIADNRYKGADASTWGGIGGIGFGNLGQIYIARNTLENQFGGDREAITTDAPGGLYSGSISSADLQSITLPEQPENSDNWLNTGVFIVDGRGLGQWRRVVNFDGNTVRIDRPWDVIPDSTSKVSITWLLHHFILTGNRFTDTGVAIQLYGSSVDFIVDGNVSERTAGFYNWGKNYHGLQPSWYIQWLNNVIEEGNLYRGGPDNHTTSGEARLEVGATANIKSPVTLGCIVRGNKLLNNAHITIGGTSVSEVKDVVVEKNDIANAELGIQVTKASKDILIQQNRFENVTENITGYIYKNHY